MKTKFPSMPGSIERIVVFILLVWFSFVAIVGYYGLLTKLPLPSMALLVMLGIVGPLGIYYCSPAFQAYVASLHPNHLVILHLWRIFAGLVFLYYGNQHLLPEQFVHNAGYGDLAVGFLVSIILMLGEKMRNYIAFHLFGLLDFIVAVGTGLTFTLLQVPLMETIATFPIVLIPLFGVPITGASSVMAIDSLLRNQSVEVK